MRNLKSTRGIESDWKPKHRAPLRADLIMLMNLLKPSLAADSVSNAHAWGQFILRVAVGLMIFYIHGWHKLKGGVAYLKNGTSWKLAEEVAEMRFPAPVASAFAATTVQFVCSLFLAAGLLTRVNAALLAGALSVAILQNVLARRDQQLAILYVLIMITLALLGGGRFSFDALVLSRINP
jgi:putative oxidoreductase